jgi:hypothetical protein
LCIYCHDNEHGRLEVAEAYDNRSSSTDAPDDDFAHKPFADLAALLDAQKKK